MNENIYINYFKEDPRTVFIMKLIKDIILSSEIEIIEMNNKPSLIIHSMNRELYPNNNKSIDKLIVRIDDTLNKNKDKINYWKKPYHMNYNNSII